VASRDWKLALAPLARLGRNGQGERVFGLSKLKKKLFGEVVELERSAAAPGGGVAVPGIAGVREVRVARVVRETDDAVTLVFAPERGEPISFLSGQYLQVECELEDGPLWRAYSLCSAPHSGELAVTVKRIEGGRGSSFLHQTAAVGQRLRVRGPSGAFVLPAAMGGRHVLLIAGGSGITPMMSHTLHVLEREPDSRVTLLYGNRAERDVIFRAALAELVAKHEGRLVLRHVLSEPGGELVAGQGLLDEATALRELRALGLGNAAPHVCMICGPTPMMSAARSALIALGVPEGHILEERFSNGAIDAEAGEQQVHLLLRDGTKTLSVAPGETILEASQRARLLLDFSCGSGDCGTCVMRMREGSVTMPEPNYLSAEERARGLVLPCIARPTATCTLEPEH